MDLLIRSLLVGAQTVRSKTRFYIKVFFFNDQAVVLHAISNQCFNRNEFQIETFGYFKKLRQTSHRTVFVHNFANYACRFVTGKPCKIDSSFSMPGSSENAALFGNEWKNMPRTCQIM